MLVAEEAYTMVDTPQNDTAPVARGTVAEEAERTTEEACTPVGTLEPAAPSLVAGTKVLSAAPRMLRLKQSVAAPPALSTMAAAETWTCNGTPTSYYPPSLDSVLGNKHY